jgi:hypothetical protein
LFKILYIIIIVNNDGKQSSRLADCWGRYKYLGGRKRVLSEMQ